MRTCLSISTTASWKLGRSRRRRIYFGLGTAMTQENNSIDIDLNQSLSVTRPPGFPNAALTNSTPIHHGGNLSPDSIINANFDEPEAMLADADDFNPEMEIQLRKDFLVEMNDVVKIIARVGFTVPDDDDDQKKILIARMRRWMRVQMVLGTYEFGMEVFLWF